MDLRNKNLIILATVALAFIVLVIALSFSGIINQNAPKITIETAPTNTEIKINGKSAGSGEVAVATGEVTIEASAEGYETVTKTITVSDDQDEPHYVGLILPPASDEAKAQVEEPLVNQRREEISSKLADQNSLEAQEKNPIITQLPHLGEGLEYRIDYGLPVNEERARQGVLALEISAPTPETRQEAVNWIREQGFFPSDYEVLFPDYRGPIVGSGGEVYESQQ